MGYSQSDKTGARPQHHQTCTLSSNDMNTLSGHRPVRSGDNGPTSWEPKRAGRE